jgi:hypothetical protein
VHLIQEIGSYAGLAAIPGLAILSALYFSQARDVRRLRDWAGRAPERSAEQAQGGRVLPQTAAAAQPAAKPAAQPAAKPAAAAAAGAAAATASGGGGGTATAAPPRTQPATAAGGAGAGPPGGPRRIAPRVPGTGQTSILGQGATPEPDPWYRRLANRLPAGRYIAILLVGIAVVGGGIAYGITQLSKDDTTGTQQAAKTKKAPKKAKSTAVVPGDVSVSVLNGTTVTGLAHTFGTKLQKYGFNVQNLITARQVAESVVLFKPGANREARAVADKLKINNIEPADSNAQSQAGNADVIVVIGADQAPAQPATPAPTPSTAVPPTSTTP